MTFPERSLIRFFISVSTLAFASVGLSSVGLADDDTVKVFVLAGQSNMVGSGFVETPLSRNGGQGSLLHYVNSPTASDRAKRLKNADGSWMVRDDVFIHFLDRKGHLTVGYGNKPERIGPELGFGQVIGESFDEPVLLIKLAWGGKSLAVDFRSPSSGGEVGPYYQLVTQGTKELLADIGAVFPELQGKSHELVGFGWHQGWNDRINQSFNDEYEANLANFIRDIRDDLDVESLPFVYAETGMSGENEKNPRALSLMKAQAAVAKYPGFANNVAFIKTTGMWRDKSVSPSGQSYHWNTNAETYYLIGEAMGVEMLKLITK